jgi:uncharacterized membrane protein YedE/YeeE
MLGTALLTFLTNELIIPRTMQRSELSRTIFSYLAGLQFGTGLFMSGMADPVKVLRFFAFLTDSSRFDPSLALIVLFGVLPSMITYLLVKPGQDINHTGGKPVKPTLGETWRLPTATVADIDSQFVLGAMVFGVTWGLRGVCPGPAVLRSVLQPVWGLAEMAGYLLGSSI